MTPNQKLQLEYDKLELRKKELEFKIVEIRNQILAERMIEEKEQSAAEKSPFETWKNSDPKHTWWPWWFNPSPTFSFNCWKKEQTETQRTAFEAGQKHQAEVEREKVRPLVDRAKQFIKVLPQLVLPIGIKNWQDIFTGALKNYQRGWTITGPDLELPEKPSWVEEPEIRGKVRSITNHGTGYMDDKQTTVSLIIDGWHVIDPMSEYKLTPIKD